MKRSALLVSLFFTIFIIGKAQISITSTDIGKLYQEGKYQIHQAAEDLAVNIGAPSAFAQSFTFSFTPKHSIAFYNVGVKFNLPPYSEFLDATHATSFSVPLQLSPETTFTNTVFEFMKITDDSFMSIGAAIRQQWSPPQPPIPADTIVYDHSSEVLFSLPIVHGFSKTVIDTVYDFIHSGLYSVTKKSDVVDGFGTLTIPQGSFPVLRISTLVIEAHYAAPSPVPVSVDSTFSVSLMSNQGVLVGINVMNGHPMYGETLAEEISIAIVSNSPTGVSSDRSLTATEFQLDQNFPNPFNPVTTITFSLPQSGLTTVKVFDILGKEVRTLVNEVRSAGSHSVPFNASDLPSGVYFYTLRSGNFTQTKKMMLTK